MGSSHYSAEFIAYAKEEDAINHQHTSNWIPCYAFITALPIIFIACAWYSNRRRAAEKKRANPHPAPPKPGKWWWWAAAARRLNAGRFSSTDSDQQQQRASETIEMKDLEAAGTTTRTHWTPTPTPTPTATGDTARVTAANLATMAATRAETTASSASVVASDTGAVLAGGEFEDVDLARRDDETGRVQTWRPQQRSGRARGHHARPVPSWRGQAALPGEFSAFRFQPAPGDWPRYEELVLAQEESERLTDDV